MLHLLCEWHPDILRTQLISPFSHPGHMPLLEYRIAFVFHRAFNFQGAIMPSLVSVVSAFLLQYSFCFLAGDLHSGKAMGGYEGWSRSGLWFANCSPLQLRQCEEHASLDPKEPLTWNLGCWHQRCSREPNGLWWKDKANRATSLSHCLDGWLGVPRCDARLYRQEMEGTLLQKLKVKPHNSQQSTKETPALQNFCFLLDTSGWKPQPIGPLAIPTFVITAWTLWSQHLSKHIAK